MSPSLEGAATFSEYRQQNPTLAEESPQVQAQVAQQFFNSQMSKQPGWQEEDPQVKEQVWQSFKQKYNLPNIPLQAPAKAQGPAPASQDWLQNTPLASFFKTYPTETPQQTEARVQQSNQPIAGGLDGMWASNNPTQMQEGAKIGLSNQLKGMTLGYFDPFKPNHPLNQTGQTLAGANQFAGTLPLWELGAAGVDKGLAAAGRQVLPYTTEIAQAAGAGSRFARPAMTALSQLQSPAMWARMLRSGLPLAGIGALESQPGHQLDLGRRAQAAGTGFLSGLLFPPLEEAGTAVLKGGVKAVRDIFSNTNAPIKLAEDQASQYLQQLMNAGMSQGRIKYEMRKFKNAIPTAQLQADLDQLVHDIYSGNINKSHVSEVDANKLGAHLQQVQQAIEAGQELKPSDKSTITGTVKSIRTKAAMKQKVDARRLQVANENHESFGPSALQDYEAQAAVQRFKERQARQKIADENHEAFGPDWQQDKAAQDLVFNLKVKKARQAIANENHESFSPSTQQHVQAKKAAKGELPNKTETPKSTKQPTNEPQNATKTPATKTREYTPEVQAELDQIEHTYQTKLKALKEGHSLSGSVYIERQIHGIGLERAAAKRKAIQGDSLEKVEGGFTDHELEQARKREASNYQGKAVIVDGKPATVQLTAFGKVKVKFEDGSTKLVAPEQVKAAPKPPPKPTFVEKEETAQQPEPAKNPVQKPLTGTVKEMVSQAEKTAGLPEGAGNLTAGQLEKQMGQPLTQEQKDVHANLREVAKTEPDPDKPIAKQMPVNEEKQLLHGEVKDSIPAEKSAVAEKINSALENGKKIKWEVAAERSGRSNEAAHVTATGNVKITPTEFTPTHWSKSNSGEVFIHGYNQRGHVTMHPIQDVHKVLKTDVGNGFQGTTPNRVLGQRDYLVSDVLNRGPRSENGAIKTSEQIQLLSELKDIYKPENFNKFPKPVRDRLNAIRKKGRVDQLDMIMLVKELQNNKENLEEFCKIVGIHG